MKKIINIFLLFSFLFNFEISDSIGKFGAVASSKKPATQIGLDILKRGGNAIDAAVAVAFALSVTHPSAGNLGGGGFMVIRLADGTVTTVDFREVAPSKASKNMFLDENDKVVPGKSKYSSWASGVPGTVEGLGLAHSKYGSLPWDILIYPSIELAKFGFPLDYHNIKILNSDRYRTLLSNDSISKNIFLKNGKYEINEIFIQNDLASTLLRIAKYGYREFYEGLTADCILKCMNRTDGLISREDLKGYKAIERKPIKFRYKDNIVYSMPPPSSGGITLAQILNQIELVDLSEIGFHSSEHIHLLAEAERRAYADRAEFLGDPNFVFIPENNLLSKEYASKRFMSFNQRKATPSKNISFGNILFSTESEETTHFSIVDKYGNAVSLTTTINGWFGNGITVDDAGFLLNNEMDDFSIKPGHPNMYGLVGNKANSIQPNKRMLSSMTPTIVEDNKGKLKMVLGTPGGSTIITTIAQIIINTIDFNMSLKESIENKRFHHQWIPDNIFIEKNSISKETISKLSSMGHNLKYRSSIGEVNAVYIDGNNLKHACSDSRRGGYSATY